MDIGQTLSDVGSLLRPDSLGDIFIYTIFFGCLITLAFIPDGNDRAQYLLFGTMLMCVVDLLVAQQIFQRGDASSEALAAYAVHIGMFVFPFITAGSIRAGKRKVGPSILLAALIGVIASLYTVMSFADPGTTYNKMF